MRVSDTRSVHMSRQELSRLEVIQQVVKKQIKQRQAAERLHVSVRQIKRLKRAYRRDGAKGLVSKKRGQASNHQLDSALKAQATDLLCTRYADFGPTLAHEKLTEDHHLDLSIEAVRQLMIQKGLWRSKRAKHPVIHPLRERRARFGELVQIDGSPYDWFEGRAPACTLLVYIDDATGRLMELWFTEPETTFSYTAHGHKLRLFERAKAQSMPAGSILCGNRALCASAREAVCVLQR